MPKVRQHIEIIDILVLLHRREISLESAFQQLSAIIQIYLPENACEGHGELIADHVVYELTFPCREPERDAALWRGLQGAPASPLAAARGVLQFSMLFGIVLNDPEVEAGAHRLYREYMTQLYPPSPYFLKTKFPTVRPKPPDYFDLCSGPPLVRIKTDGIA
jgi:hypothetical protein